MCKIQAKGFYRVSNTVLGVVLEKLYNWGTWHHSEINKRF